MPRLINNLWFGNEESYFALLDAESKMAALMASGPEAIKAAVHVFAAGRGGTDQYGMPSIWHSEGNVAVVDIGGSLIAGNAGFLRLFGALGYGDIQDALAEIAADKDINSVLLNIDSGGGQVDGLSDTGDMIRALDQSKPVLSYTGGTMGSAAYWLGASARHITAAPTSQSGSVGTIIVHSERSKQRMESGIKDTIIRYGKYKALGNPLEPLSEDGKTQLQNLADESGKIFVDYVSGRRGMTAEAFQKSAGEGRVFMGRQAMEAGLVDAVGGLAAAVTSAKGLDKPKAQQQNPGQSRKGPHMFAKKTLLAIAAGTALAQLGLGAADAYADGKLPEGDALKAAETEASELVAAFAKTTTDASTKLANEVTSLNAKVTELTSKVTAAESAKTIAEAASVTLQGQLKVSTDFGAESAKIVKASMSVMSVALGGAADVGASLVGTELLAEHDKLAEKFKAKFPNARVSAVGGGDKKPEQKSGADAALFASLVINPNQAK